MRKIQKTKLDPFAETLDEMDERHDTLHEMAAWVRQQGVSVDSRYISRYLTIRRRARLQVQLLENITSGAQQCAEVEKRFRKDPAPGLETLIKLLRVVILQLSTQAQAN